jgi:NADPH:quinone reductase-like Zn-dependent oxidoreductase
VLHDWGDATCGSILQNCCRALRPGGRVIVIELLDDDTEPTPLLAQFDQTMMVVCGSKERTMDEYNRRGRVAVRPRGRDRDPALSDRGCRRLTRPALMQLASSVAASAAVAYA